MGLLDNKLTPVERVKVINAVRGKLPIDYSTEMTIIPVEFEEQSSRIPVIIPEREAVNSFFADYYGARGTCRIIYKTTAEWDSDPELIARRSVIYVYLDADSYVDGTTGDIVYVPAIKLGDDHSKLIDLPLMTASTSSVVMEHINDAYIHIQPGEREQLNETLESKLDKSAVEGYIALEDTSGTLTAEEVEELRASRLKPLVLNDTIYTYTVRMGNIYRYMTTSTNPNEARYIDVDMATGEWEYGFNTNSVLEEHINDQTRHVTAAEKAFWNNKINCEDTVSGERLILNRN